MHKHVHTYIRTQTQKVSARILRTLIFLCYGYRLDGEAKFKSKVQINFSQEKELNFHATQQSIGNLLLQAQHAI